MLYYRNIFFCIVSLLILACSSKDKKGGQRLKSLPVIQIVERDVTGFSYYTSSIEGIENIEIFPKIQGFIKQINVDEGSRVKKGDLLFQLEAQTLDARASAAGDAIKTAQVNVDAAQIEVDKLIPLVKEDIISNVELESAKANLQAAESRLNQARSNYRSLKRNANYKNIYSPVDGVISRIPFKQGTLVSPTETIPLTTVSNVDTMYAYFSMNEKEYLTFLRNTKGTSLQEKINNFPKVELVLADGSLYGSKGVIDASTAHVDPNTGTIQFRASFPNPNSLLANGYSGTVKIPKYYKNALVIPEQSTFEQQTLLYVYTLTKGDTLRSKSIKAEARVDNLIIVESGLKKGDKIVAEGLGKAKNGIKIKPNEVPFDSIAGSINPIFRN